jgi:hypothetical protein
MFKDLRGYVKKGFRQAKNAVGGISHIGDTSEFDSKVKLWETQVEGLKKLKESLELYLDALATINAASAALSESINQHFSAPTQNQDHSQPSPYLDIANLYDKINKDITNVIHSTLKTTIFNRCMKPLIAILSTIPDIYQKLAIRKDILLDRDVYSQKVEKDSSASKINQADLDRHQCRIRKN